MCGRFSSATLQASSTYSYLVWDSVTHDAVFIDSVREQHARDAKLIEQLGLKIVYLIDTHVHGAFRGQPMTCQNWHLLFKLLRLCLGGALCQRMTMCSWYICNAHTSLVATLFLFIFSSDCASRPRHECGPATRRAQSRRVGRRLGAAAVQPPCAFRRQRRVGRCARSHRRSTRVWHAPP